MSIDTTLQKQIDAMNAEIAQAQATLTAQTAQCALMVERLQVQLADAQAKLAAQSQPSS